MKGQEVGGDFYDVFQASPGRWVAVIGDVCGKGPESASLTALARYTLRAVGRQATGPSDALRALNEAILEQRSDHRFVTAVLVQLDVAGPDDGVALSNGGHPPPLLVRAGGDVEEVIGGGGMLLGIYPDPELVDQRVELRPGDSLVLFTDGLAERRDPHVDVPGEVRELLRSSAGSSAGEVAGRLGQLALSEGGKLDDDVAVVVLRRIHSRDGNGAATAPSPGSGKSLAAELEPGPGAPAEARAALSPLADALPPLVYMASAYWSASSSPTASATPGFGRLTLFGFKSRPRTSCFGSRSVIRVRGSSPKSPSPAPGGQADGVSF